MILGVDHGALGRAQLTGTRLHRQGLHPNQDVVDLAHRAVGDLKHRDALTGVARRRPETRHFGGQAGADGQSGRVVLGRKNPLAGRKLGKGVGRRRVGNAQIAMGHVGGKVGNDVEGHRSLLLGSS